MHPLFLTFWRSVPWPQSVHQLVERLVLYPYLPHIKRSSSYPSGPPAIASFLQSGFGIAQAARFEVTALRNGGIPVELIDLSETYHNQDLCDPAFKTTENLSTTGPLFIHVNGSETGRALKSLDKKLVENRPIIGIWAWELNQPPPYWDRAYRYLDELWVPTMFVAEAFRESCPLPLKIVPHPVTISASGKHDRTTFGLPEKGCLFLCMADARSDFERKNILGSVAAFRKRFDERPDINLALKVHHTEFANENMQRLHKAIEGTTNIHIIDKLMNKHEVNDLINCCDVFVSLHRAEGFGLPLAEAMLLGKPVIATAYSGNMDFMPEDGETLIDYKIVPVATNNRNYQQCFDAKWADPDIEQTAAIMARLADDQAFRARMGQLFADRARMNFSEEKFCAAVIDAQRRYSSEHS